MIKVLPALMLAAWSLSTMADTAVRVDNAWVREAPPGAHMMAGYMTIKNQGASEIALTGVDSPAFDHVMLHESRVVDGVARMIHQDEITIPAHGSVELKPGGFHLMIPAPEQRLVEGDKVEFVLTFSRGKTVRVQADIRKKP